MQTLEIKNSAPLREMFGVGIDWSGRGELCIGNVTSVEMTQLEKQIQWTISNVSKYDE